MKNYKRTLVLILLLFASTLIVVADDSSNPKVQHNPIIIHEIKQDVSPPLRDIPPVPGVAGVHRVMLNPLIPRPQLPQVIDSVLQTWAGPPYIPSPLLNFEGIDFPGVSCNCAPPDTNGDVGPTHYVQIVNTGIQMFNKSGASVFGPVSISTLWNGFSGRCSTNNDGDPVVVYDGINDRWVVAQFVVRTTPYLECVAVSTTGDPTGSYNRYSFDFGNTDFNDYPKMGVWPDAYYATYNIFAGGASFTGAEVCAMDRAKMLNGLAATQQCFKTSNLYGGLLPSDLDGPTPPPAGSPNYVLGLGTSNNDLAFWKFHVDWANPANTTFTGPSTINVAAYTALCNGGRTCVPQGGTTQQLDGLSDRLMNRLAYRNFGDHESLVVNHSVIAAGGGGVRWYEIRSPGTTPLVFQQGTYAPDANYRWMGSIAMDQSGDIGLGFSLSSTSLHPEIHYTGRLVGDPAGTMPQGEATIIAGNGSQTGGLTRWGDYSDIVVDPADGCTFWYTTEYIPANGSFNWHTRVGTFKFASCGGGGGCTAPSSLTNNAAADADPCADTGVNVTWAQDAGNWGDSGSGTRTYDVLRNGVAIASGLSYGTTSLTDTTGTNGTAYTYSVRYNNGCGLNASTTGATASDSISCNGITLTTSGYKVKGLQKADLSWSPSATTLSTDVYRNGSIIATVPNNGAYTDNINKKGRGTYTYKVCEAGSTTNCSNDSTVTF
jgi:hypothetical protein